MHGSTDASSGRDGAVPVVVALTLTAAVLRAAGMHLSFSGDDFAILEFMGVPSFGGMMEYLRSINYAPAYPTLFNAICKLGTGEVWTRVPGTLAGIACVPVSYAVVRRLLDRDTALVTAALVAISQFHIDQSLQLKPMTLFALETLASVGVLERWVRTGRRGWLAALVAVEVALLYTHYFSIFLLFFQGLVVLGLTLRRAEGMDGRRFGLWVASQVGAALLYVPWLIVLYRQVASGTIVEQTPTLDRITVLPELALTFTVGYTGISLTEMSSTKGVDVGAVLAANAPMIVLWIVAFVPAGLLGLRAAWRDGVKGRLLLGFLATTLLLPLAVGLTPQLDRFSPKLVIGASFGVYALVALAITRSRGAVAGALVAGVLAANLLSLWNFYVHPSEHGRRSDWRAGFERIEREAEPGDVLALANTWASDWYHRPPPPVEQFHHVLREAGGVDAERARVAEVLSAYSRVWFLELTRFEPESSQALALEWLESNYRRDAEQRLGPTLVLHRYVRR